MNGARPRMRVGLLSERADLFGGGQRSVRDLARTLYDSEVEPWVLLPGPGPLMRALEAERLPYALTPFPSWRAAGGTAGLRALRGLAALMRRLGVDLVHSDAPRTALYGGLAARLTRRRHLWHLRASRPSSALADRFLLSLSDAVVAVSSAAGRRSPALRGSPKLFVIPTGLAPFAPLDRSAARAALGLPAEGLVAGVIGRVEPDKGADDALSALVALRAAVPGASIAFLGPVDADEDWVVRLRLRAATLGLSESVRFLGPRAEAAPLLPAFDLILHPSRHEALPRVLIEALFAAVPIVATAVGGIPEVIVSGESGLLVPPGDPVALGRAAARLASDPALRARLTGAGLARARARFTIEAMRMAILSVYERLVPRGFQDSLARREASS